MRSEYTVRSELIKTVTPKRFTPKGKLHFYVRIFLDGPAEALDNVELVRYTLHPTFVDRVRVSASRQSNFDIRIWTYGYFDVSASVVMRDGNKTEIRGYVDWDIPEGFILEDA